eukprot:IDg2915t1
MVTLTTVGYGDLSPTNTYSKIFVVYYVLVSMTLISSYLTELMTVVIDHNSVALTRRLSHTPNRASHLLKSTSRSLGLMSANESDVTGALSVLASSALVCVLLGVGFAIYVVYEDLSSVDAVYATIISASTVGFGDLNRQTTRSKLHDDDMASLCNNLSRKAGGRLRRCESKSHRTRRVAPRS